MEKTKKAYEIVIDSIKEQIMDQELVLGQSLPPEREISEKLGVSRNSVREALKILSFRRGVDEFEFGELRVFLVGDLDAVTQVLSGVDQCVGPCAVVAEIERILRFRIVGAEQVEADVVLLARGQVVNLRKNFAGDGREFDVCA